MNPKPDFERYITALRCEEPDRVPLGDWHVDRLPKESFMGKKLVTPKDHVDFWCAAGFDYVTSSSGILEPVRAPEGMTIKGDAIHTEYGEKVPRDWARQHEGVITSWEQFEKYPWPSVDDFDLSKWGIFDRILPSGMKAVLLLGKIFTPAWMYMGAEVFYDALENNQELVSALFHKIGKIQYDVFLRVIEHPCVGAVLNPDDIAHNTGLFVDPRYLRRYLFPWYKRMGDVCRDKGFGFIFHSDGNCTEILEDLLACGFHGFNPVQPNAMDIQEVKRGWGNKLCLIGNINLDSTLTLGAPQDVRAEVFERIRTLGPGGGYMVASSNSITDYVPLANMKALFEATFEFGRYPIELEEGGVKGKVWKFQGKPHPGEAVPVPGRPEVHRYVQVLLDRDVSRVIELVQKDIDSGIQPTDIVGKRMVPALTIIGEKFQKSEIYIPEMMIAAQAMSETLSHFEDLLGNKSEKKRGTVAIGTVRGDLHEIGKNLVSMLLRGQGFTVEDLGVSVSQEEFVRVVRERRPDILGMSALLTSTMIEMGNTIHALKAAGLRGSLKIIVGGAPVTQEFASQIGADGYAYDAPGAVEKCKDLLSPRQ
jgi:methanogenic corrinoid protein MtbC1